MYDFNNDKQLNMQRKNISNAVDEIVNQSRGEVVLFPIIEKVRELVYCGVCTNSNENYQYGEIIDENFATDDFLTKESNIALKDSSTALKIVHGATTSEQKSEFQSHVCAVNSMADVNEFKRIVLEDKKV